jgi:hypothetical protein
MTFPRLSVAALLFLSAVTGSPSRADELLPPYRPVEEVVDHYVDANLQKEGITPAGPAEDANFIRRVTLDLAGRIPTPAETQEYVQSSEPDKKAKLVDRLLASPDFAYHQRNELDLLLMAGKGPGEWRDWLLKTQQENRPWKQLFREVMLTRDDDADNKAALAFLKARAKNVDDMTNDTSRLFFGISINCAKCHDHPLVLDWTQDHFYGMASFFSRTYLTKKNYLGERDDGVMKFLPKDGQEKQAKLMFLTGAVIEEPVPAEQLSDEDKKQAAKRRKDLENSDDIPEPPAFSRRAQLVDVALRPDPSSFFSRSFVNRTWARVFGTGLVTPLDQMHSENPPSHPELLAWLARDAESHDYDIRRLLRGLVLSRAYGRSSRWEGPGESPAPRHFAVAEVRALSPMQFSMSLLVATANPLSINEAAGNAETWVNRRKELENQAAGFAKEIEVPGENFQVSVSEALLFSNNERIEKDYLRDSNDRLPGALKSLSDRNEVARTAYLSIFSRPPDAEETAVLTHYLNERTDRPVAALQQALWAMITSGEFRFNY